TDRDRRGLRLYRGARDGGVRFGTGGAGGRRPGGPAARPPRGAAGVDAARGVALPAAKRARQLWTTLGAPYETARARLLVGRAFRELGDEDSATAEFGTALRAFHEL